MLEMTCGLMSRRRTSSGLCDDKDCLELFETEELGRNQNCNELLSRGMPHQIRVMAASRSSLTLAMLRQTTEHLRAVYFAEMYSG